MLSLLFFFKAYFFFIYFYPGHAVQHVGWFPNQGSNLGPLQWKRQMLTVRLPGNSRFLLKPQIKHCRGGDFMSLP